MVLSGLKIHLIQFNKDFIENSNEDSDEAYFHEVDINI